MRLYIIFLVLQTFLLVVLKVSVLICIIKLNGAFGKSEQKQGRSWSLLVARWSASLVTRVYFRLDLKAQANLRGKSLLLGRGQVRSHLTRRAFTQTALCPLGANFAKGGEFKKALA